MCVYHQARALYFNVTFYSYHCFSFPIYLLLPFHWNYKINCKYLLASCILINPHALVRAIPIQPCIYLLPPPQNTHPRSRAPFAEVWRFYCIVIESNGGYQWSETFELDMAMYVHSHITSHKITPNLDTGTRVQISAYYNETTHPRRYRLYRGVVGSSWEYHLRPIQRSKSE